MEKYWRPAGMHGKYGPGGIPEPGQLIGYRWDRKPYRVIDITDVNPTNWHSQTLTAWEKAGQPDAATWDGRERMVLAEPARNAATSGQDRAGLRLYPWARLTEQWWPLR